MKLFHDTDPEKAATFMLYLAKAQQRLGARTRAEHVLKEHLKALRKGGTKQLQTQVDRLQTQVKKAEAEEKKVRRSYITQQSYQKGLKEKIVQLEQKLDQYITVHKERENRMKELEGKIQARAMKAGEKLNKLEELKDSLKLLSTMHDKLKGQKGHSKAKLTAIEKKMSTLHKRIKQLQSKHSEFVSA